MENEKKETGEKEAADQQIMVLTRVADMETEKQETAKKHEATIIALREESEAKDNFAGKLQRQMLTVTKEVLKRCWQSNKGEVAEDEISEEVNPFMVKKKDGTPDE